MSEFVGAGKAVGIEIWRIEKMVPVKHDEFDGKLYSGDSYILLSTTMKGSSLVWHLHFWLGEETSQDESGVAAYKTVELDESLGGGPVQHRECQGHESDLFMTYFKETGLEYLKGGMESGFNKVERDVYRPRLLQCKGKRAVRCTEKELAAASLNSGDSFILDLGLELFLWNGAQANKYEKAKGAEMIKKISDERGAKGSITIVEGVDKDCATFWEALGGQIEVTDTGESDEKAEVSLADIKLHHVSDASGAVSITPINRNEKLQYTRDMLDTKDAYILDCGDSLFVWTGKESTKEERKESMHIAAQFIADQGRPSYTPVERNVESGESAMFKSHFFQFDPVLSMSMMRNATSGGVAAAVEEKDSGALAGMMAAKAQEEKAIDDGSGKLEIWRVEDFKKVEVDPSKYGQFYGGDSYVLLYTYKDARGKENYLIYFWQGSASSKDEIGASALLAKELDDSMGGAPVQVRVVQGKEPLHFRSLFKGSMVIHDGGKASGFKNTTEEDNYDDDGIGLYHCKGTLPVNCVGVQTKEVAASLNSMDSFVLVTPTVVYNWGGKGALPAELESAAKIASLLKDCSFGPPGQAPPTRTVETVPEGSEPDAFWAALGGQGEYAEAPEDEPLPSEPRLFQCTDRFGSFQVEEIASFTQEDMLDDDVMLLDIGTAVYLWIGSDANAAEATKAMEVAVKYVASATDGRDPDISIMQVSSGNEPLMFTQFFPNWDDEFHSKNAFLDPYEAKLQAIAAAKAKDAGLPPPPAAAKRGSVTGKSLLNPAGGFKDPASNSFPYEELAGGTPEGVDPTKKEVYLSDAEFSDKFGVSKAEFEALAAWKKKAKKETLKLF